MTRAEALAGRFRAVLERVEATDYDGAHPNRLRNDLAALVETAYDALVELIVAGRRRDDRDDA